MKRKSRSTTIPSPREKAPTSKPPLFDFNFTYMAILGAVLALGVGIGIAFASTASSNPQNLVTREAIDRSAPNAELCVQYGASAMVTDMRVYVTMSPFSVYVTQPNMQPGCVLRKNNWSILEQRKLVTSEQVRDCKNRMNTFGFTGALEGSPKIACIYQNNDAGNTFFNQPGTVGPRPETDNF